MARGIVLFCMLLVSGCGVEVVTTAATGAAAKAQEAKQAQQTMQNVQQNVNQMQDLAEERAKKAGDQ
jgi:uncharacterized protein YceK